MTSVDATLEQRGSSYGEFKDNALVTQSLMNALRLHSISFANPLLDTDEEAMHMICHNIARIVCGHGEVVDNWHDIAGYAKLAMVIHPKPAIIPGNTPIPTGLFGALKAALVSPLNVNGTIQRELKPFEAVAIDAILMPLAYIATDKIFAYHSWEAIVEQAQTAQDALEDLLDE
jgi:hypothetical protein